MLKWLEKKLLAKYLQYKINQLLEGIMEGKLKARVAIMGVEVSFIANRSDTLPVTIKVGEVSADSDQSFGCNVEEMKTAFSHYKEDVKEIVPAIITGISQAVLSQIDPWISASKAMAANRRDESLLDQAHNHTYGDNEMAYAKASQATS